MPEFPNLPELDSQKSAIEFLRQKAAEQKMVDSMREAENVVKDIEASQ